MSYSYIDFSSEGGWATKQELDMDKANDTATKVVECQGYLLYSQAIMCLGGASFDEVIDHDVRIWEPKTNNNVEWIYPI